MKKPGRILALLLALLLCATATAEEGELAAHAMDVYDALAAGEYERLAAQFDETMAAQVDAETLRSAMEGAAQGLGAMTGATLSQSDEASRVAVLLVEHESGQSLLQLAFDDNWQISGLYLQPVSQSAEAPLERELPEGVQAEAVTLFAGEERELPGEILIPDRENAPFVIFAHGSGPNDMDESIGANRPFRDLAYDLAALGIGSLRFDKITYAAPNWPVETVEQEYLEPVEEALRVLRERTRAERIYLVGHSEGGMLAPYLVAECGFDGGVALAGTPKQLWEISRAQNLALMESMDEAQREAVAAQIEEQTRLAERLAEMSDEEAAETTVFGMSAIYLRHMARMDPAKIARDSGKPFLFLWGTADAQVDRDAFEAWRERLGEGPYSYVEYEGLNHLFIPAQEGENLTNLSEAYGVPSRVDAQVAEDIANWIAENQRLHEK